MIPVILIILCCCTLFLILRMGLIIKCLNEIIMILDDVILGNKNGVCHVTVNVKAVRTLGERINKLISEYQNFAADKKKNEILTKKLISDISHDIRTPLTSILGYIDVLSSDKALSEDDKNLYINIISSKGQLLHTYIDELFEYVKLEAEDVSIKLSRQNLTEIVRIMLCYLYQDFLKENITPVIEMPEEDLYVWGDCASIKRILNNLLTNALRYGKSGNCTGIALREESDRIWVDVWDKGRGISQEDLKYIFSRLYTSGDSYPGGSGIGLSIAKRLVQKMNGNIYVDSVPGEKTTFTFYLKKCS